VDTETAMAEVPSGVFARIYCKDGPPSVAASEAHIFPYALDGSTSASDTVCGDCNGRVNREVEERALPSFRVLQSLLGITGRRGKVPGIPLAAAILDMAHLP
jgi:HNH endonuclease